MACSNCGNSAAYSRHSCSSCNPARRTYTAQDAASDRTAGYEFGYGVTKGTLWLLDNRYLSYAWFWLVWLIASGIIGQKYGVISEDWMERPFWFDVIAAILPIAIAIVFRKQ